MIKKIKKAFKRLKKFKLKELRTRYLPRLRYPAYYRELELEEHTILLESQHGNSMQGNIYYLMQVLASDPRYKDYRICLTARENNVQQFREQLDRNGMQRVETILQFSKPYMRLMATAKYLINDTTFLPFFVKKPGQIYLNTWHGTPLKTLGKRVHNDCANIGNVQKNFLMADYLLYPNVYTMEHMVEDYMLSDIAKGKILLCGYPRNTAFFRADRAAEIRKLHGLERKQVYAYMPTWRGVVGKVDGSTAATVQGYLTEMDAAMREDEALYVNLHPFERNQVDFTQFKHVFSFPEQYETYEFLNIADCLITDYSSVFFDFSVTGRKCVLFTYDEEEYFADRGLYRPLSDLPFPNVKTTEDLLKALRAPKTYDDTAFLQEYCAYDCAEAAAQLCARVILGEQADTNMEEREIPANGKPNVLLYAGNLAQNGITTSLLNLLEHVDRTEKNYYVTFVTGKIGKSSTALQNLPEGVRYLATTGKMNLTFREKVVYLLFMARLFPLKPFVKRMGEAYAMENRRSYADAAFSDVIQFNGYETRKIMQFAFFDANRVIYVHNDMDKEIRTRNNQRRNVLEFAYSSYDKVAVVTEDLLEVTGTFLQKERELQVACNLIADERIRERGMLPLCFDPTTRSTVSQEQLQEILSGDGTCLISVGRFSPEKGHRRLIDAFNRVWQENPNSYLIIVGGNQLDGLYDKLCEYASSLSCSEHIVLILSLSNPFPLIKACDGFILSSFYEGFGLVLVEADILGLPVVSTDITGPRTFMQKYGGLLVEDSEAGIEQGLRKLLAREVPMLNTDYDAYNRQAVQEFYNLLERTENK